ncbi:MAG: GNAT family N-acetyltransferase [Desulfobacterales bacterium]
MRIAIVHNAVTGDSLPDEQDVINQVEVVSEGLRELQHEVIVLPCGLNLTEFKLGIERCRPDLVFNLVESLDGQGRLISVIPSLLEIMGIPYTGSPSESIYMTSNKVMAKQKMWAAGLPTPAWIGPYPEDLYSRHAPALTENGKTTPWIIKSVWEHASLGLYGNELVCPERPSDLMECMRLRAPKLGGICFAEQFIDGREFNISIIAGPDGPQVLPPAEIIFEGYQEVKPRIVCYHAKWDEDSFEYSHTPRQFDFLPEDASLIDSLKQTAIACWHLFGLGGYARVDFRVDPKGNLWILEVNTNPCLSPDAGFAAALARSGMTFSSGVSRIIDDALNRKETGLPCCADPVQPSPTSPAAHTGFRSEPCFPDIEKVGQLVKATGFFHPPEIDVAVELVEERLSRGPASGYSFVFYEYSGRLTGYSCYGQIPCTSSSYDIYWIAVHPDFQKKGLGRKILDETERLIQGEGGRRIYVDTSQSEKYHVTRSFYEHCGYRLLSILEDFYAPGDGKAIFCKSLDRQESANCEKTIKNFDQQAATLFSPDDAPP